MVIPTTGLLFFFGAFVYLYLGLKFYRCYQSENNHTARLFAFSFFLIGLNYIVSSIPCLFLIENQDVWQVVAPIYGSLMAGGWLVFAYAVFAPKSPKYKTIFIVLSASFLIIYTYTFFFNMPTYFFTGGTLDWEINPDLWILSSFFFVFIVPLIAFFFRQALKTKDKTVKIRSLGFGLALVWLLVGAITDFFLITLLKVNPIYSDLNYFMTFIILAITLIVTWFPPKVKYITKIE